MGRLLLGNPRQLVADGNRPQPTLDRRLQVRQKQAEPDHDTPTGRVLLESKRELQAYVLIPFFLTPIYARISKSRVLLGSR